MLTDKQWRNKSTHMSWRPTLKQILWHKHKGYIDSFTHEVVAGWAKYEGKPTELILCVNNEKIVLHACLERKDLTKKYYPPCAFRHKLTLLPHFDYHIKIMFPDGTILGKPFVLHRCRRYELASQFLNGQGIEIGALHRPLRVPTHAHVQYVDRMDKVSILSHYPELKTVPLVTPDIIDDGESLKSIPDNSLNFVIANHFLEHTEDPIFTLKTFARVLKNNGIIYLGIPEKDLNCDQNRPLTTIEHLKRDHESGPEISRKEHYLEYITCVEKVQPTELETHLQKRINERYSIHFHVWSKASILEFFTWVIVEYRLALKIKRVLRNKIDETKEVIIIVQKTM